MNPMIKKALMALMLVVCFGWGYSQTVPDLKVTNELQDLLNEQTTSLAEMQTDICKQVEEVSKDVKDAGNGGLTHPNWVRFVQIAEAIELLNDKWNDAYGDALEQTVEYIIQNGLSNIDEKDEYGQYLLSEIIEEKYLIFPEDIASVCFESKFNFQSLRICLSEQDENWVAQQPDDFNAGEVPSLGEELDEEFWTLITCEKQFHIDNPLVEPSTFEPGTSEAEQGNILTTIKDIVAIIKGLLEISGELIKQMEDCAATSSATVNEKRDGFLFDGNNRKMGYKMIQKGIFFDGKATKTKIKGKAFLWVKKGNGKFKKDRKARAGISFCAKEWDGCVNKEWPSDPGVYRHPRQESRKKAKVVYKHSSALSIEKSWHFLQFKFGRNGIFAGALNLLGVEGCTSGSNTNW